MEPRDFDHRMHTIWNLRKEAIAKALHQTYLQGMQLSDIQTFLSNINVLKAKDEQQKLYYEYEKLYTRNRALISARENENWANTWDHVKTLLYRAAYGIVICVLFIFTALAAQVLDIELPLLRFPV